MSSAPNHRRPAVKVFVATTVLLSFISFWRAAAIVLSDLGSSAYYVGGDAEKVIGKSAPWFILALMLFANCVRALYIESTSMFVRGGVYRVVRRAMGGTLAKFSVSALMFDYVLTGPISAVSAGLYLGGLINETAESYHLTGIHVPPAYFADESGKPLHSWRVLILPFLDEGALYKQYDFSEPWDGPNNSRLLARMPRVWPHCPHGSSTPPSSSSAEQ